MVVIRDQVPHQGGQSAQLPWRYGIVRCQSYQIIFFENQLLFSLAVRYGGTLVVGGAGSSGQKKVAEFGLCATPNNFPFSFTFLVKNK